MFNQIKLLCHANHFSQAHLLILLFNDGRPFVEEAGFTPPHFSFGKYLFAILFFAIYVFYATLFRGG